MKTIKIGAWFICGLAAFVLLWDASAPAQGMTRFNPETVIDAMPIAATTTTTTTTPLPKGCAQYVADAITVGWPAKQAPTLARVMFRESRCRAISHNRRDTVGQSYGLMQINSFWCTPSTYWPKGWLQTKGVLMTCDQLLDPKINLTAGLAIWHNSNWTPWNVTK